MYVFVYKYLYMHVYIIYTDMGIIVLYDEDVPMSGFADLFETSEEPSAAVGGGALEHTPLQVCACL